MAIRPTPHVTVDIVLPFSLLTYIYITNIRGSYAADVGQYERLGANRKEVGDLAECGFFNVDFFKKSLNTFFFLLGKRTTVSRNACIIKINHSILVNSSPPTF